MQEYLEILLDGDDDSQDMLQATLNLNQFLNQGQDIPLEGLQKISQNLGDELVYIEKYIVQAPLRKASHQFFQHYIRSTRSFKGILSAMNTRGLIDQNVNINLFEQESIRQKNVNSLQSLLISEVKCINWNIPEMKAMHDILCKRMQDPKLTVKNAAEQTFISLIKIQGYQGFYQLVSLAQQEQVKRFVEIQKQQNIFPQDFELVQSHKQQANSMYVVQNLPEVQLQKQFSGQKDQQGQVYEHVTQHNDSSLICPPFDLQDFKMLKDQKLQNRQDAIQNILYKSEKVFLQLNNDQLYQLMQNIIGCIQDNNLKMILPTLDIITKVVSVDTYNDGKSMLNSLISKASDSKQAIRATVFNIFNLYLGRVSDNKLLQQLVQDITKKANNGREEVLELVTELCSKNKQLMTNNMKFLILELAPLMEDSKTKLKMNTLDLLIQLTLLGSSNEIEIILQNKLNRVYYDMYQEKLAQAIKGSKRGFTGPLGDQAIKSWQGQQKPQQTPDVIFHTPPRLGQKKFDYNDTKDANQLQPVTQVSTSTSARSDMPQSLANRLKNKGDMIASKNNQSNETSESSYVPSLISKDQQQSMQKSSIRNSNNRKANGSFHQSGDDSFDYEQVKEGKTLVAPDRKIKRAANSSQNFDDTTQQQPPMIHKQSSHNEYSDYSETKDSRSIGKPFKINKTNQNYAPQDQDEDQASDQKVSSTTYSKPFQKKQQQPSYEPAYTQPTYQTEEDLEELQNPEAIAKTLLSELKYDDWQRQFEALNNLRRLIKYHSTCLRKYNFHGMIVEAIKLIENLRSGLSKNGLLTLYEASNLFRKELDAELELAMQKLVKKSIDSSTFISEEVTKVMIQLMLNCSEQRCILILQNIYQSKQIQVRVNVAFCISTLIMKMANEQRAKSIEFEKLFQLICAFVVDQSGEVRQMAKSCIFDLVDLVGKQSIDSLIGKSGKESIKIRTIIDKGRTSDGTTQDYYRFQSASDDVRSPSKTPELKPRQQSIKNEISPALSDQSVVTQNFKRTGMKMTSTTKSSQPKLKDPQAFVQLEQMLTQAQDHEWKNRIEATNFLFELGTNHSGHLSQHKLCNKYLDTYIKLINDSNIKVAIQAAQQLLELVPSIKLGIQQNAANVWTGLFQALSSNNIQVRQSTELIFQNLCQELDANYSIQQICQNILYGPQKSKSLALNMFIEFTNPLYEEKPQLFVKYVLPMVAKMIDDTKPDIKSAVGRLVKILNDICPEELKANVSLAKLQLFLK